MGNEKNEEVVDTLEDMLGLNEEVKEDDKKEESSSNTEEKEQKSETSEEEEKEKKEDEKTPKTETTVVTPEQITISKEIAKIDVKLEELEKSTVNMDDFYANIENELTEQEQQLEFDDKAAYMKLINEKAREYESKNSQSEAVEELKKQKEELEGVYERQNAIVAVSEKFPDYNHEKMLEYFNDDLSKSEQKKIFESSASYEDVYENTYKRYLQDNPAKIEDVKTPDIPNVNNVRKQSPTNNDTDADLQDEDERLKEALGL